MSQSYGPPLPRPPDGDIGGEDSVNPEWGRQEAERAAQQKKELQQLLDQVMDVMSTKPDDAPVLLPGLVTRHIDLLLGLQGVELLEEAMQDCVQSGRAGTEEAVSEAVDYIFTFVDEFVAQAKALEDENAALLGRIVRAMKAARGDEDDVVRPPDVSEENPPEVKEIRSTPRRKGRKEQLLDDLLKEERDKLTPGFLRHLEGQCRRISSARKVSPDDGKLLEILRLIQARVLEEIGRDQLGEGALVLGQLLGYDDKSERLAVLDAGLLVRGVGFARELQALTQEALAGLKELAASGSSSSLPSPDPELVRRVQEIHDRVQSHVAQLENARRRLETQWTGKDKQVDPNGKNGQDNRNPPFQ